jgi:hypothetical protein
VFSLTLSSSFTSPFRVLKQQTLAALPQQFGSSHGLLLPSALSKIEGPLLAGLSCPAMFRLQGLITLLTAFALRFRAGFVSRRQRSWDSPFGAFSSREASENVSARNNPLAVFSRQ